MRKALFFSILLMLFFVSSAHAEVFVTHTSNFDFENNTTSWKMYASNLTQSAGLSISDDAAMGSHSVRIAGNASSDVSGRLTQDLTFTQPLRFTRLGVYLKAENANAGSYLKVRTGNGVDVYTPIYANGNQTYRIANSHMKDGWHYYEIPINDADDTTTTKLEFSSYNLLSGAILVDGITFSSVVNEPFVESRIGDSGVTTLQLNTTYTPAEVYANSTLIIRYENYSLTMLPASTSAVLVDGVLAPSFVVGNNIYVNVTNLSAATHTINVTTTLGEPVTFTNKSNKFVWEGLLCSVRYDSGVTHGITYAKNNTWIDNNDYLHLSIQNNTSGWSGSELYTMHSNIYGNYEYVIESSALRLDKNAVGSLYTYEDDSNENDLEFSLWQNQTNNNTWFTVQPYSIEGHQQSVNLSTTNPLRCSMNWQPTFVHWTIHDDVTGALLAEKWFTNSSAISTTHQNTTLILWMYTRPYDYEETEIVFRSFDFTPFYIEPIQLKYVTSISTSNDSAVSGEVYGFGSELIDSVITQVQSGIGLGSLLVLIIAGVLLLRILGY